MILLDSEGTDIGKKLVQDGLLQVITCRDKSIQHFVSIYSKFCSFDLDLLAHFLLIG